MEYKYTSQILVRDDYIIQVYILHLVRDDYVIKYIIIEGA